MRNIVSNQTIKRFAYTEPSAKYDGLERFLNKKIKLYIKGIPDPFCGVLMDLTPTHLILELAPQRQVILKRRAVIAAEVV